MVDSRAMDAAVMEETYIAGCVSRLEAEIVRHRFTLKVYATPDTSRITKAIERVAAEEASKVPAAIARITECEAALVALSAKLVTAREEANREVAKYRAARDHARRR